ncbi:hypothetical protein KAR91_01595, partial [Candidatus Pacearchaeota archaeon]|nr:hypothetical protein [Candidatus Pacearchaeota archaeon]
MSYNPAILDGTVYLAGREDLNGSLRFTTDAVTGCTEIQKRISGVWQPASFETGPNSLWVGRNVGVAGIGHHLATEAADGHLHFHVHSEMDGQVSIADAQVLNATSYEAHAVVQSDDTGLYTGQSFGVTRRFSARTMAHTFFVRTGSTPATSPVRLRVYEGTDANGTLIFDQYYPINLWVADTEITLELQAHIEFEADTDYFLLWESATDFSFKTDSSVTEPWCAFELSMIREDNLLQTRKWGIDKAWTTGDYFIDTRKIYICNVTGNQYGTFAENADKWDGLGDHLLVETDPVFTAWDKSTGIMITESQISDLDHFTTEDETDPVFTAWDKSTGIAITVSQVTDHSYAALNLTGLSENRIPYGVATGGLVDSPNLTYFDSALRISNGGIYIDRPGDPFIVFKRDGTQVGQIRATATNISITGSGGSPDRFTVNATTGAAMIQTSLNVPEISNTAGDLKIQPDVQGDVELFGDADVDDAVNGKILYVRRQAVEGDEFIRLYVSHTMAGVISASSDLTAYAEGSVMLQSAAKDIICRMGDDVGAKGTYFKNSSNAIVGSVDSLGNAQFNVSIDVPEISNTTGLLKIQPDVQGDVELFGDTDVGNDENSKIFKVWRRAPEGNDYIRMYISASQKGYIHTSCPMTLQAQVDFTINSVTEDIIFKVGDSAGAKKFYFKDSGGNNLVTLDSNGLLYVDANEGSILKIGRGSNNSIETNLDSGATDIRYGGAKDNNRIGTWIDKPFQLVTNSLVRATITNDGEFLINRTTDTGEALQVGGVVTCSGGYRIIGENIVLDDAGLAIDYPGGSAREKLDVVGNALVSGLINNGVAKYNRGETQPYHYNSWDCTTARYKQTKDLTTWGTAPHDSAFSPDGTKVFITDNTSEEINEFALSTPWDVSSMTWTSVKNVSSEESNPMGICFNLDGTKMYIVGSGGDEVNMYTLSTAWTLSTATPTNLKDLSGSSGTPNGIRFRPDGLMMFISDGSLDEVQAWTLTTAWDVTTATYTTKFDASMDTIESFSFSPDGYRLYVVDGSSEDDIHEYELGTPWDITTGVHTRSLDLTLTAVMPNSVTFSPDGRKMYVTDNDDNGFLEFDMGFRCEGLIHTEQLVIGEPTAITPWLLPLEVVSADNMQANFHDSRAQAAGTGGGIGFTGHYTDAGDVAVCATIEAEKVNSVSGDYGFDLVIQVQQNGSILTEALRCHSTGDIRTENRLKVG